MHNAYNPDDISTPAFYSAKGAETSKEYRVIKAGEFVKMQDGYIAVPVENLDPILSNNFETALTALIEHRGADALTSLSAVMRHHGITFFIGNNELFICAESAGGYIETIKQKTRAGLKANDIKPEK